MSVFTRYLTAAATLLALWLPGAPAYAQGVFPSPEALPALQLEVAGSVNAIARYNDGVTDFYVIGGAFDMVNGAPRRNIARLNLDGSLADEAANGYVATWRTGTNAPVLALAIVGTNVYVGGEFVSAGGSARSRVAKFALSDGSLDAAWAPTPNNIVRTLAAGGGGTLFIGGSFTSVGGVGRNAVAKLQVGGGLDTGWNAQIGGNPTNAVLLDGGSLYVCGKINKVAGIGRRAAVRVSAATGAFEAVWNPDFKSQGGATCYSLAADTSNIYAGGVFRRVGANPGNTRNNLVKLAKLDGARQSWNPGSNGLVRALALNSAGEVYVGGDFTLLAGTSRARLGKVDAAGAIVAGWSADANRGTRVIALSPTEQPLAGGNFSQLGATGVGGVARLSATTGAVDAAFLGSAGGPGMVNAYVIDSSGGIILGGAFDGVRDQGGLRQPRANMLRLLPNYSLDLAWTADTIGEVSALAIDPANNVYVGGNFTSIKGVGRTRLAKLAGAVPTVDATFTATADGAVRELLFANTSVYAGGDFQNVGGQVRAFAAKLNMGTGAATAWNPDPDGPIEALLPDASGVFLGGAFTSLNGAATLRNNVALVDDVNGTTVASFNADTDGDVLLLTLDAGQLYVGGAFATLGGQATSNLGRVDPVTGAPDATWVPQISGTVRALDSAAGFTYVGGQFALAGGQSHPNLARVVTATGAVDAAWQPGTDQEVRQLDVLADTTVLVAGLFDVATGLPHGGVARFGVDARDLTEIQGLSVSPSGPNAAIGQDYTVSFTVANLTTPATIPTGTLSVTSVSVNESLNCAVVSYNPLTGAGSCTLNSLQAGAHTVTVTFVGDPAFMDATANTSYAVGAASTTLGLSTASPSVFGASVSANLSLAASSAGAAPTGLISVEARDSGNVLVDSCTVAAALGASNCVLSNAAFVQVPGAYSLTASYVGDANYGASNSTAVVHVVAGLTTTTSITAQSLASTTINQSYLVTVAVTASDASTATGSLVITDQTGASCNIDAVAFAGGDRDCDLPSLSVGSKTLRATFTGTGNYGSSDNSTQAPSVTHDVTQASTTLTLALAPATPVFGETVTATVTLVANPSGVVMPSGTITVTGCAAPIAVPGGNCTFAAGAAGVLQQVTATYAGDANFSADTDVQSVTPTQAATTLTLMLSPANPVFGETVTATVNLAVNSPGAGAPSGSITVTGCAATIAVPTGSCTYAAGAAGVLQQVTATYAGDANFSGDTDVQSVTPAKAGSTFTSFTSTATTAEPGQSINFTWAAGAVAPGAGTLTGNVQVSVDGLGAAPQCTAAVASGTCDIVFPTAGSFTMRAVYAGDANFNGSISATRAITIASGAPLDADLQILKEVSRSVVNTTNQTEQVEWTIVVANEGPGAVVGARVTDVLPASLTSSATWTCTGDGGGAQCANAGGNGNINVLVNLPSGTTATLVLLTAVVNAPFPGVTNTAQVEPPAAPVDPDLTNNSSSAFYQACFSNRGTSLAEHFCLFRDGFESPPSQ